MKGRNHNPVGCDERQTTLGSAQETNGVGCRFVANVLRHGIDHRRPNDSYGLAWVPIRIPSPRFQEMSKCSLVTRGFIACLMMFTAACADFSTQPRSRQVSVAPNAAMAPYTLRLTRQEWREIASHSPGFAGLWLEGDTLVIGAAASGAASRMHEVSGAWLLTSGRSDLLARPRKIQLVRYDYAKLDEVRQRLGELLVPNTRVIAFWIDSKRSRAMIGVSDEKTAREVREAVSSLNLQATRMTSKSWETSPSEVARHCKVRAVPLSRGFKYSTWQGIPIARLVLSVGRTTRFSHHSLIRRTRW